MYQYTLDPEEDLRLSRPSSEQISQTAAKQVAPTADNTDFLQQAMKVLGDRRAQQQANMPKRSMPASAPRPDVAADDWKMLLAMGLNLLGNKGKDLGQIAMAATQQRNQRVDDWRAQNSPEAQLKRELQLAQLRNADGELGRAETAEAAQLATQLRQDFSAREGVRQFDTQETRRAAEHADDVHFKGLDVTDRRTKIAQDQTQFDARLGQDAQQFQLRLAQDAQQSRAQLGLGYGNLQLHRDEIAAANARNDADNAAMMERARIAAEARKAAIGARGAGQDARLSREFTKDTKMTRAMAQQINAIDSVLSRYEIKDAEGRPTGKYRDLPGAGRFDSSTVGQAISSTKAAFGSRVGLDAENIERGRANIADIEQRVRSGAAGPVPEKLFYELQAGAQKGASEAQFLAGLKAAREVTRMELSSAAAGREGAASHVLRSGGLNNWAPQTDASNVFFDAVPDVDPASYGGGWEDEEEQ